MVSFYPYPGDGLCYLSSHWQGESCSLNLDWPCDLLWPLISDRRDDMPVLNPEFEILCEFLHSPEPNHHHGYKPRLANWRVGDMGTRAKAIWIAGP
jgi:hypothetical protein